MVFYGEKLDKKLEHSVSLWRCVGCVKDFHTINNIFESPSYREKQARVLKLFVFCQFLVQGFQIKVENSSVVSFCRCLCRGSLCRDIGRECHIAALLDILALP